MSAISSQIVSSSQHAPFVVYYCHNQTTIELKFKDYRMRVEEVIFRCIEQLSDIYMIKMNENILHYALYPATRPGKKPEDCLQISYRQRIKGVGVKKFYLQYLNLSKESISTEINLQKKYGFQKITAPQNIGCCSAFAKLVL